MRLFAILVLCVCALACGDEDIESVFDVDWVEDPIETSTDSTQRTLRFTSEGFIIRQSCPDIGAEIESPALHGAVVTITEAVGAVGESDIGSCSLGYEPATFGLALEDGNLRRGEDIFSPDGETSGIYGYWTRSGMTVDGTPVDVNWLVRRDTIRASAICGGAPVVVDVPVEIINIVEVPAPLDDVRDSRCILRLGAGVYEYEYLGDTIEWDLARFQTTLRRR